MPELGPQTEHVRFMYFKIWYRASVFTGSTLPVVKEDDIEHYLQWPVVKEADIEHYMQIASRERRWYRTLLTNSK
jgi:hypothetical protein